MFWIIGADGREYGPVARGTVVQWIAESRANAQSWVRAEGGAEWQPLGAHADFASALSEAGPPKPPVSAYVPLTAVRVRPTNSMATASFVMGLLAITCGFCCCYGFPFNLLGVLFGVIALVQLNRMPELEQGKALAVVGLVLSLLSLAASVGFGFLGLVAALPDLAREMRRW